MVTIKDIAREAGVSHGTVSNVLNKTGKVSIEKIRIVEETAKRLGYVPNTQAQLLRQGTPSSIAVIIPSLKEEVYLDLYTAIKSTMQQQDYKTDIFTTDDISSNEENILERLRISGLAAVVTVSCLSAPCCESYSEFPCPVIYVDRKPAVLRKEDGFFSFDFKQIGASLGAYIREKNWRTIACFSSPNPNHQSVRLFSSLREWLEPHHTSIYNFSSDYNLALNTAFDIAQSSIPFDAVITNSSVRAGNTLHALRLCQSVNKPQIVTLGTSGALFNAEITTFELDYSQMGVKIAYTLLDYLRRKLPIPQNMIFSAKGFSFQFPHVKKLPSQTLSMLTLNTPSTDALQKLLPLFEAISGVSVKMTCVPYEDLHTQIDVLSSEFYYDLIRMDVAKLDNLGPKTYLPLQQAGISIQELPPKLLQSKYDTYSQVDGTIYALPFDPSVQLFLYRSDLFNNAKIRRAYYERNHEQLEIPTSIEQYLRIAEFFTKKFNPESPTTYGATMTNGTAAIVASDFLPFFLEKVAKIYDSNRCIRTNIPEMVSSMQQYKQMEQYACQQSWWKDSVRQFANDQAATTVVYSNYAADIMDSRHSNVVGKVGAAIIPGGRPLLGGGVIGISRYCKNLEACKQFFNWFYSPNIASILVQLGGTSPLMDVYNDFKNFSIFPWLSTSRDSLDLGVRGIANIEIPGFSIQKYEFAIGTALRSLISGVMTAEEAAAMAQAMYDSR